MINRSTMRILLSFSAILLLCFSCVAQSSTNTRTMQLDTFLKLIDEKSDKIKVINFWATWCAPCIAELPYFQRLDTLDKSVEVILVSLDLDLDPNPEKVHRYIERKRIETRVVLLDAPNPNTWIDKVDKRWSGAIPFTLIVNSTTGKRIFIERQLHDGELESLLTQIR